MQATIVLFITALTLASSLYGDLIEIQGQIGSPPQSSTTSGDHEAHNSLIDRFAHTVSEGISQSDVVKKALPWEVRFPHNMFYRVSTRLLLKAGIVDPLLAEVAAKAGAEAAILQGKLRSNLYIDTIGYEVAKFLDSIGLLTEDKAVYLAFMVVTAIELEACIIQAHDAESMENAVVFGLFDTFSVLGHVTYPDMQNLFHIFARELLSQARKSPNQ